MVVVDWVGGELVRRVWARRVVWAVRAIMAVVWEGVGSLVVVVVERRWAVQLRRREV